MLPPLPLHLLRAGQRAVIAELVGSPADVHRLEEMGLHRGTRLEMLQRGSPCIIRADGQRLCFRRCEEIGILVRTEDQLVEQTT